MSRAAGWFVAILAVLTACGHQRIEPKGTAFGNFTAVVRSGLEPQDTQDASATVLLIERRGLRAVDPVRARQMWFHPLRVTGHPAADGHTVVVPVRGHRLVALDRKTGTVRWSLSLPGEALTGLSVSGPHVVATVVGGRGVERSQVIALASADGHIRWSRRSAGRFGAPLVAGESVIVPVDDNAVALDLRRGQEIARVAAPGGAGSLDRVVAQRHAVVWAGDNRWIDLGTGVVAAQSLENSYAPTFRSVGGFDPGHDDGERLSWWIRLTHDGSAPREAVLMARRVLMAVRLDADARPVHAHWVHLGDEREAVALDVGHEVVTVVREDGSIVRVSMADGRVVDRLAGLEPVRGALFLDMARQPREAARYRRLPPEAVVAQLAHLLAEPDPRVLPAQRLAADLLWRDMDPDTRDVVVELSRGRLAADGTGTAGPLRSHAIDLVSRPWGQETERSLESIVSALAVEPSFLDDRSQPDLGALAHEAVRTGNPAVIPLLVRHLLHPATPAGDLAEIARALLELDRPEATEGLAEFVLRYRADPEVVQESSAMRWAVEALLARSATGAQDSTVALAGRALAVVAADPFTEAGLRAYIGARLPTDSQWAQDHGRPRSQQSASEDDDVLVLSDSGL